jgi:hypothetical protein
MFLSDEYTQLKETSFSKMLNDLNGDILGRKSPILQTLVIS